MSLRITGHKIKVTPAIRNYVKKKFSRLTKYFENFTDAHVVLTHEGRSNKAEVNVNADHRQFIYKATNADLYSAIDMLIDKAELGVSSFKKRQKAHHSKAKPQKRKKKPRRTARTESVVYEKPMSVTEAILQLEVERAKFKIFTMISDGQLIPSFLFKSNEGYFHIIQQKDGFFSQLFSSDKFVEYIFIFSNKTAHDLKVKKYAPQNMSETTAQTELQSTKEKFVLFQDSITKNLAVMYRKGSRGTKMIVMDF